MPKLMLRGKTTPWLPLQAGHYIAPAGLRPDEPGKLQQPHRAFHRFICCSLSSRKGLQGRIRQLPGKPGCWTCQLPHGPQHRLQTYVQQGFHTVGCTGVRIGSGPRQPGPMAVYFHDLFQVQPKYKSESISFGIITAFSRRSRLSGANESINYAKIPEIHAGLQVCPTW